MNLLTTAKGAASTPGVPIFMFHRVNVRPDGTPWPQLYIKPGAFAEAMRVLHAAKTVTVWPNEPLVPELARDDAFVLTFDDGFVSAFEHAGPLLAQLGFRAINFLVADRMGMRNEWDTGVDRFMEPLMDQSQVREWLSLGHEIGGHTLTHPHLDQLPLPRAREEIAGGKKKLEDTFGREVRHFAYPYGSLNAAVVDLVREAGFVSAVTIEPGLAGPASDRLLLPRLCVDDAFAAQVG